MRTASYRPYLLCGMTALLLTACSPAGVRLSDRDRTLLDTQPVIHVVYYETGAPQLKYFNKPPPSDAQAIRRTAGDDPASLVASSLARLIGKKENLRNLKIVPDALPRPVASRPSELRLAYRDGLVLETWVDRWSFEAIAGSPGQYLMALESRARLVHPAGGRMLWSTGQCRVHGAQNRSLRIAATDFANPTKLRKVLSAGRNDCARQLLRDFSTTS